jgi:nucleotide-binding universal stress UspA family protein
MARPNKIIVAYDGSHHSKKALEWAIDLSRNSAGKVIAVYVSEPVEILSLYSSESGMRMKDAIKELEERGRDTLEEAKAFCASHGVDVKTVFLHGNIAHTIITYARNEQADLIIAGTKGHGELEEMLMGSVTRNLVSLSSIPVLVVKD